MKNKKLHSWKEAEDKEEEEKEEEEGEEEEEEGGREVGLMVGMLSTLINMKSFDDLWSLVHQSRSLVMSSNK